VKEKLEAFTDKTEDKAKRTVSKLKELGRKLAEKTADKLEDIAENIKEKTGEGEKAEDS
jgi:gas vesicle protein